MARPTQGEKKVNKSVTVYKSQALFLSEHKNIEFSILVRELLGDFILRYKRMQGGIIYGKKTINRQ